MATNERLRTAMAKGAVEMDDIVAATGVDPKTVQRWLRGRTPHRRHRWAVAALLREEEDYLWPSARGPEARAAGAQSGGEVIAAYGRRADAPRELWTSLLGRAQVHIDIMGYAFLFLPEQHPDLVETIQAKCRRGCRVRISLADPSGQQVAERDRLEGLGGTLPSRIATTLKHLEPLRGPENVEFRLHRSHLYNAVYRFDDDMIVTPYLVGAHGFQHPLLHLRRLGPYGVFESFAGQFEKIWGDLASLGSEITEPITGMAV